ADHEHDAAKGKAPADHHDADDHDADHHDAHRHDEHHHHEVPDSQREVTSVLLLMKDDLEAMKLARIISKGDVAQAVFPAVEVSNLVRGAVGPIRWVLLVLALLVVIVAGIGVMVSIYNSMNDRRRDIAIMRSLGAGRRTVMFVILLESILLSILGGLAG